MSKSHHHHHLYHPHLHRRKEQHSGSHPGSKIADQLCDPKGEGLTPYGSRRGSRRPSVLGRDDAGGHFDMLAMEKPQIKAGLVRLEKEKSALRATELRESLIELNTTSNNTTRQLDNLYYSILEKHSALQSTVASMQELALVARHLDQDFKDDTSELVSEIDAQLSGFQNFTEQREQIEAYAERIKAGREKVKTLCERLEVVRGRVEKWQKSEGEWRQRTRRRLRILWTVIITCVLLLVALLIFQYSPQQGDSGLRKPLLKDVIGGFVNETTKMLEKEQHETAGDVTMRSFDEL